MLTTLLIALYVFEIIQFDIFVKIFACLYGFTSLCMAYFLNKNNQLRFVLKISPVTRHLKFEIFQFVGYVFTGMVIFSFAQQIDSISITGQIGLTQLGVYILAQYIATVVQVPQRSIASIATPYLAIAWKDSNFDEIRKIYSRSSINLLIISLFIFFNIWLNIDDAYDILGLEAIYETGKYVVLILSITKIIDLGTGINSQLLYTSPSWRFDLFSGILLLVLSVILNVFLVRRFGIIGAAFANLAAITAYNSIRVLFIYKKYNMQPFSLKTIFSILIAIGTYFVVYFSCAKLEGVVAIGTRSVLFSGIFLFMVYIFRLTPDFRLVIDLIQNKLKRS
jgi:O-antigen/teichoic acid export membrane protein